MPVRVVALVSTGRHPVSGRARRAPLDARAVELGLRLAGADLELVHVGEPEAPALRDYLGMGAARLTVLRAPAGADAVAVLAAYLGARSLPELVLSGQRAEGGEDTGLLPYLLAERLGLPVLGEVVDVRVEGRRAVVRMALPRGRRRALAAPVPLVLAVGGSAPSPRPVAHAQARRGRVDCVELAVAAQSLSTESAVSERPARARPRRIRALTAGEAAQRLAAATGVVATGRKLEGLEPEAAAEAVLEALRQAGVLRAGSDRVRQGAEPDPAEPPPGPRE